MSDIVCFGSCNIDLITYTNRMPKIGETIKGKEFSQGFGGKGANQIVMAAKMGAKCAMISMLGDDAHGKSTLENFESVGVACEAVGVSGEQCSGVASIIVDDSGHNCIIIVPGANDLIRPATADKHRELITGAKVLLTQLEIPLDATMRAMEIAAQSADTKVIFNPAPAVEDLPESIYALVDVVTPNETEAELLSGVAVNDAASAEKAARVLIARGARAVIVTLGEQGCVLVEAEAGAAESIAAPRVTAVDTTGAGDSFNGALAYGLANGDSLATAARRANIVASRTVLKPGTQKSYPELDELLQLNEFQK